MEMVLDQEERIKRLYLQLTNDKYIIGMNNIIARLYSASTVRGIVKIDDNTELIYPDEIEKAVIIIKKLIAEYIESNYSEIVLILNKGGK